MAFGSEDKKLYLSKIERPQLLWRFATGGPIDAPLGFHGVRTLIVPSTDKNVYAVDLFTGESRWTIGTGAPVKQEPIVADDDVYVVNVAGFLSSIDAKTGEIRWTVSTLGGRLLSVSQTKVYLESHDDDLFVVDRATGKIDLRPRHDLRPGRHQPPRVRPRADEPARRSALLRHDQRPARSASARSARSSRG